MAEVGEDTNAPYCSNCGYRLTGLTESSKCPECGKPVVEVLVRGPHWRQMGKRYRSKVVIFGLPLIHVAVGPSDTELRGHAKGIIAIGDMATGFFAIGGFARGLIALGGLAIGLVAIGGGAVGLIVALGGGAVGGLALGGGSVGLAAQGGGAVGVIADGGGAYGYIARGGSPRGKYTYPPRPFAGTPDPILARWEWLIGSRFPSATFACWVFGVATAVTCLTALIAVTGYLLTRYRAKPPPDE